MHRPSAKRPRRCRASGHARTTSRRRRRIQPTIGWRDQRLTARQARRKRGRLKEQCRDDEQEQDVLQHVRAKEISIRERVEW